jgi:hypothetical protein
VLFVALIIFVATREPRKPSLPRWEKQDQEIKSALNKAADRNADSADIELIKADEVNNAYDRMLKSDVRYRFVIDLDTLSAPA